MANCKTQEKEEEKEKTHKEKWEEWEWVDHPNQKWFVKWEVGEQGDLNGWNCAYSIPSSGKWQDLPCDDYDAETICQQSN